MSEYLYKNEQKRNNFRTAFIRCNCDSELLVLRYDQELDSIDLCLFESQQSFNTKMSWRQKLRYIIQLFKTGQPFIDQILLDRQQINELKAFLNSI